MGKKNQLARLVPKSMEVTIDGGEAILVPLTADGNKMLNMVVAAQIRDFLQRAIKRYNDEDVKPSPKDIRDLAEAGKTLADFSASIFVGEEPQIPKTAEKSEESEVIDFDKLEKDDATGNKEPTQSAQ